MQAVIGVCLILLGFFFGATGVLTIFSGKDHEEDVVKMSVYSCGVFLCLLCVMVIAVGVEVLR